MPLLLNSHPEPNTDATLPANRLDARCPSCGADRVGSFCHACGQRLGVGRLTLRGLWRELPSRFFNLDRGFLHTFIELFKRPGAVPREYVAGRRSTYINPLAYFLVAATVQLIGLTLAHGPLHDHMTWSLSQNPGAVEKMTEQLGEDAAGKLADIYIGLLKKGYTYLFLFFASIPFALYLRVLMRKLETRYNLAETLVFSIYTTGHLVLITGAMVPFIARISMIGHAIVAFSTYLIYTAFAARRFYDGGKRRIVYAMIALAGAFLTFTVFLGIAFAAYLAVALSGNGSL